MIKQLKRRFIALAMAAVTVVIIVIVGFINVTNYHSILDDINQTMQTLVDNHGELKKNSSQTRLPNPEQEQKSHAKPGMKPTMPSSTTSATLEMPYTTRHFSVHITGSGEIRADTDNIAAIDQDTAVSMAQYVLTLNKEHGFLNSYRYSIVRKDQSSWVCFLDCANKLASVRTYLGYGCLVSLLGFAVVFAVLFLISGRVIKPIAESYEKQKRFITDAGHELKTPLTIIRADADVLDTELSDNEWLQDIYLQVDRLTELTNNLVCLSRMDEEKNALAIIPFSLSDVVFETVQSFQSVANLKGNNIILRVQPTLSMRGDEKTIRQLVSILLDNALKYGIPDYDVVASLQDSGRYHTLTIENAVSNMMSGQQNHLFDRFYRADESRNSQKGGYGLGLSIAKSIVSAHKGTITANSPKGETLIITVQLPK